MNLTRETVRDVIRDMMNDRSTDLAAYRIRCYANRLLAARRREQRIGNRSDVEPTTSFPSAAGTAS